jgi:hypothetical protein
LPIAGAGSTDCPPSKFKIRSDFGLKFIKWIYTFVIYTCF